METEEAADEGRLPGESPTGSWLSEGTQGMHSTHSMRGVSFAKKTENVHTMSTLLEVHPDSACPFYVLANRNIPGSGGQVVVSTSWQGTRGL